MQSVQFGQVFLKGVDLGRPYSSVAVTVTGEDRQNFRRFLKTGQDTFELKNWGGGTQHININDKPTKLSEQQKIKDLIGKLPLTAEAAERLVPGATPLDSDVSIQQLDHGRSAVSEAIMLVAKVKDPARFSKLVSPDTGDFVSVTLSKTKGAGHVIFSSPEMWGKGLTSAEEAYRINADTLSQALDLLRDVPVAQSTRHLWGEWLTSMSVRNPYEAP